MKSMKVYIEELKDEIETLKKENERLDNLYNIVLTDLTIKMSEERVEDVNSNK